MKKFLKATLVLFLTFTSILAPSFAQEASSKKITFTISPYTSVLYGHQGEYVFTENSANNKATLSYLEWDMKPAVMVGYELQLTAKNNIFVKYNSSYGLPLVSGHMQDSDWMNNNKYYYHDSYYHPVTIILTDEQYKIKTNYSISDEIIKLNLQKEISTGFNFHVSNNITFTPIASFEYSYIYFEATNGYSQYVSNTCYKNGYFNDSYESVEKKTITGKAISLRKHSFYTWIGLSTSYRLSDKFTYTLDYSICPYAYIFSLDYHWQNGNSLFIDEMHGTNCAIKTGIKLNYNFNKNNSLVLKTNFMMSDIINGITKSTQIINRNSISISSNTTSGSDVMYGSFSIGYIYTK